MHLRPAIAEAGEVIIGNLEEDGYLTASDEELLGIAPPKAVEVKEEGPPPPEISVDEIEQSEISDFGAAEDTEAAPQIGAPPEGKEEEKPFLVHEVSAAN